MYKTQIAHVDKRVSDGYGDNNQTTKGQITQLLKEKFNCEQWQTDLIFNQIKADEYIDSIEPMNISLKGMKHIKWGGYRWKQIYKITATVGGVLLFAFAALTFFMQCSDYKSKEFQPPQTELPRQH